MRLSASSRYRWKNCPGAPKLEDDLRERGLYAYTQSAYAARGALLHALIEEKMRGANEWRDDPSGMLSSLRQHIGQKGELDYTVTLDDVRDVSTALCIAHALLEDTPEVQVETPVSFYGYKNKIDLILFNPETKYLRVVEFKYGKGMKVDIEDNAQLQYYAVAAWTGYVDRVERVDIGIIQPAFGHHASMTSHTLDDLRSWKQQIRREMDACTAQSPVFQTGSWCKWCPCLVNCPKYIAETRHAADMLNRPRELTDPELGKLLSVLTTVVRPGIAALKAEVVTRLEQGAKASALGWKLVEKKRQRVWRDFSAVEAVFEERGLSPYEHVPLTPAKVEKMIRSAKVVIPKDVLKPLYQYIDGAGYTLVPYDSKQPEIQRTLGPLHS